ncbi:MAG: hypothetical protein ACXVYB_00100 [Arthrobacter sp.]
MQITAQDTTVGVRQPTVIKTHSLGREFFRSATWEDGGTIITVTAISFVTGIRARRNADGSIDLLDQVTRFDVMGKDEFVQPVERALFLWERTVDGTTETEVDRSDEVGLYYQPDVPAAEEQCRIFIENLDFVENFDPAAWE